VSSVPQCGFAMADALSVESAPAAKQDRREMAILRSVGARPWHIATLLIFEAFALALSGVIAGVGLLYVCIAASRGYLQANYGLDLPLSLPSEYEWTLLGGILVAALLMGSVPAWRAYRQSLADGLSIRL